MTKYVPPTMEVFDFESEDIIMASALFNWAQNIEQNESQDAATAELAKPELKEYE